MAFPTPTGTDPNTISITYRYQTDDNPAEDLAEIGIRAEDETFFTTLASSDPASTLPLLKNDGAEHTIQIELPSSVDGKFATLRVLFSPDGDATCGDGLFILRAFGSTAVVTTGTSGGNPCFIATAAYGTPLADDIDALREVRDSYMMENAITLAFVDAYYRLAPFIAERVAEWPVLAAIVRVALLPVVMLCKLILNAPVLTGLAFLTMPLVVVVRRRRARARA